MDNILDILYEYSKQGKIADRTFMFEIIKIIRKKLLYLINNIIYNSKINELFIIKEIYYLILTFFFIFSFLVIILDFLASFPLFLSSLFLISSSLTYIFSHNSNL